jgi:hypothetical protein
LRTFYFWNRDHLTIVVLHRIASAAAGDTGSCCDKCGCRPRRWPYLDKYTYEWKLLEGGRVAAFGTHDELMRAGGTYSELYTLQARAYATF